VGNPYSRTNRNAVLPDGFGNYLRRRLALATGVCLVGLAALTLLSIFTFDPADPSFNRAVEGQVSNLLGVPGAYVADMLLQSLGITGVLVPIVLAVWGWRLVERGGLSQWWLRMAALLTALLLGAAAADAISAPTGWPIAIGMGGVGGALMLSLLSAPLEALFGGFGRDTVALGSAVGSGLLAIYAFGLSGADWLALVRRLAGAGRTAGRWGATHARAAGTIGAAAGLSGLERLSLWWEARQVRRQERSVDRDIAAALGDEPAWRRVDPNAALARSSAAPSGRSLHSPTYSAATGTSYAAEGAPAVHRVAGHPAPQPYYETDTDDAEVDPAVATDLPNGPGSMTLAAAQHAGPVEDDEFDMPAMPTAGGAALATAMAGSGASYPNAVPAGSAAAEPAAAQAYAATPSASPGRIASSAPVAPPAPPVTQWTAPGRSAPAQPAGQPRLAGPSGSASAPAPSGESAVPSVEPAVDVVDWDMPIAANAAPHLSNHPTASAADAAHDFGQDHASSVRTMRDQPRRPGEPFARQEPAVQSNAGAPSSAWPGNRLPDGADPNGRGDGMGPRPAGFDAARIPARSPATEHHIPSPPLRGQAPGEVAPPTVNPTPAADPAPVTGPVHEDRVPEFPRAYGQVADALRSANLAPSGAAGHGPRVQGPAAPPVAPEPLEHAVPEPAPAPAAAVPTRPYPVAAPQAPPPPPANVWTADAAPAAEPDDGEPEVETLAPIPQVPYRPQVGVRREASPRPVARAPSPHQPSPHQPGPHQPAQDRDGGYADAQPEAESGRQDVPATAQRHDDPAGYARWDGSMAGYDVVPSPAAGSEIDQETMRPEAGGAAVQTVPAQVSQAPDSRMQAPRLHEAAAGFRAPGSVDPAGVEIPPTQLLESPDPSDFDGSAADPEVLRERAEQLEMVLQDFGIRGEIVNARPGPVVTLFELEPAPGIRASRVIGLADDIARSMSALSVRIAVVPGQTVIGIELPNPRREMVHLRALLEDQTYTDDSAKLPLALGKDIGGVPIVADLARMPHLLIAGTTGSGKSVAVNAMILSLLFKLGPDRCRFIMVDPKMLELSVYNDIPQLLSPVVTDPKKAVVALKWAVREMEDRYKSMSLLGVRNIDGYNARIAEALARGETLTRKVQTGFDPQSGRPIYEEQPLGMEPLPYIVVVVDEMADLMLVAGKEIEAAIQRLAQMARAAGIHLIMATQRPSVDVITGTIKANFPTRISFQVTSKIDSRTILGEQGAEQLLGQGDMLYMAGGGRIRRIHGPFVSDAEVEQVTEFLKAQGGPQYVEGVTEETGDGTAAAAGTGGGDDDADELYESAVAVVVRERKASTSFIQRHLQIGYNRAARIIERMEKEGVVGEANHVGKREVLWRRSDLEGSSAA